MFEYGEAILACPVVDDFAKKEDRYILRVVIMPCRLRVKEVVDFLRYQNVSFVPIREG